MNEYRNPDHPNCAAPEGLLTAREILDRKRGLPADPVFVSDHDNKFREATQGFGDKEKPEDYLEAFKDFIQTQGNKIPALVTVVTRPQELTRRQLRELQYELDKAGFTDASLTAAWRKATNQDIAASIVGHIRRAALGDALVPYGDRVAKAIVKLVAAASWTPVQRKWLERIGRQLEQEVVVDRAAMDRGQFAAEGGWKRIDKIFDGRLERLLGEIVDEVWRVAGG